MMNEAITQSRVKELLDYDVETGAFTWKVTRGRYARVGRVAGHDNGHGYTRICIDGIKCMAHRLAWMYVYGKFPDGQIDHENGVRSDNRIENLRDVTQSQNQRNSSRRVDNNSGVTGVIWDKKRKRWHARINMAGKMRRVGCYKLRRDAVIARKAAEKLLRYHPNHGRDPVR